MHTVQLTGDVHRSLYRKIDYEPGDVKNTNLTERRNVQYVHMLIKTGQKSVYAEYEVLRLTRHFPQWPTLQSLRLQETYRYSD